MRQPSRGGLVVQVLLALTGLSLLAWPFFGAGTFDDAYGGGEARAQFAALANSGWVGLGASFIALLIGVPAAWFLSSRPRSLFWPVLCILPLALAPSAAASGWLHWTAPAAVRSAFRLPGLDAGTPLFSMPGVALVLGLGLWPVVAFEAWPAFAVARGEAYGAALLAGSRAKAFFRVALPMALGEVAAGTLLAFLLASSDFTVSSLLLVRTSGIAVHDQLAVSKLAAAAYAALPFLGLTLLTAALAGLVRRHAWRTENAAPGADVSTAPSLAGGRGGRWGLAVLAAGLALGFLVPLAGCAAGAFGLRPTNADAAAGLLRGFEAGFAPLANSLRLAAAAAVLATLLGAVRVILWPQTSAWPLRGAGLLLLIVPGALLAGGLRSFGLAAGAFVDGAGAAGEALEMLTPAAGLLMLGYLVRFVYLPLRLAEEGLRGLDPSLLESAELSGHGAASRGLGIALPLVWRHLLAAAALVFVLVLGELILAHHLAPPGIWPATVWLFNQQHNGYIQEVFGLCLMLGAAAFLALLGTGLVLKLAGRRAAALGAKLGWGGSP